MPEVRTRIYIMVLNCNLALHALSNPGGRDSTRILVPSATLRSNEHMVIGHQIRQANDVPLVDAVVECCDYSWSGSPCS
jgi:hypothetical protein